MATTTYGMTDGMQRLGSGLVRTLGPTRVRRAEEFLSAASAIVDVELCRSFGSHDGTRDVFTFRAPGPRRTVIGYFSASRMQVIVRHRWDGTLMGPGVWRVPGRRRFQVAMALEPAASGSRALDLLRSVVRAEADDVPVPGFRHQVPPVSTSRPPGASASGEADPEIAVRPTMVG